MRRVTVCVVALAVPVCLTAFAPAPLPRPSRGKEGPTQINLRTLAGTWRVVGFAYTRSDGNHAERPAGFTHVEIKGGEWAFVDGRERATYPISMHDKKQPVAVDFWTGRGLREEDPIGRGIIRRQGDSVEVVYSFSDEKRAAGFDPPAGHWLLKLQRQR